MASTRSAPIGQPTTDRSSGRYTGRQRSYSNLAVDMASIADIGERRLLAVIKSSLQDVTLEANLAAGKGGRMRVDTGFLRASGQASLTGMPSGPTRPPEGATPNSIPDDTAAQVGTIVAGMDIGDAYYFGWTADYARYRELYDGFLEGALMQWSRMVAFNADTARKTIKK